MRRFLTQITFIVIFLLFYSLSPVRLYAEPPQDNLIDLSIEELMEIEVTTASKKEEKLFDTPAAVYVITAEDIRRSGVRTIPDALRIVPGVEVAQINSNEWAITIRGFNNAFANKLLVLVDGRSVYTPLFGGVVWSDLNSLLSEIERIEVIRGPGGAIWGANAVNGVINIITRNSRDTVGNFVEGGAGDYERGFVNLRHGGKLSDVGTYKIFANYFNTDSLESPLGGDNNDNWQSYRTGIRLDLNLTDIDELFFTTNFYGVDYNRNITKATTVPDQFNTFKSDSQNYGFDSQLIWHRELSSNSYFDFQVYYDFINRDVEGIAEIDRHTINLEFLNRITFDYIVPHDLIWGVQYRFYHDNVKGSDVFSLTDPSANINLYSAFIQNELSFFKDRLIFTIGSKFEHNDFTGFEIQPNFRLLLSPDDKNRIWGAISKAVRVPTRVDDSARFLLATTSDPVTGLPVFNTVFGNPDLESETVWSFELGYRSTPLSWINFDITSFINLYESLEVNEAQAPIINDDPPGITVPFLFVDNVLEGKTYGVEFASTLTPYDFWKLRFNYTFLKIDLDLNTDGIVEIPFPEGANPQNQFGIQSFLNLPYNFELDASLYWVDDLEEFDVSDYTRLDIRIGYMPIKNLSLSIVGQNLLDGEHLEFGNSIIGDRSEIERNFIGSVRWDF